jgi:hypothetical protein
VAPAQRRRHAHRAPHRRTERAGCHGAQPASSLPDTGRGAFVWTDTGARILIAEGAGEYAIYNLTLSGAALARHVVWLQLAPDAYMLDERIGPSCGGEDTR